MAVYVDELRRVDGRLWCHMLADTDAELLSTGRFLLQFAI